MPRRAQSFAAAWDNFVHLDETDDSLARDHHGLRRWFLLPYIAFIVPVEDQAVVDWLAQWQTTLCPWLDYDPQPVESLHITLHNLGRLYRKPWIWMPHTWRHVALHRLAEQVRQTIESRPAFEVQVGPLNAFPNVLFAEVQDCDDCLRSLRVRLRRALPLKARFAPLGPNLPHITLGYWGQQSVYPLAEMLRSSREDKPLPLKVTRVKFTVYTFHAGSLGQDVLHKAQEEVIAEFRLKS